MAITKRKLGSKPKQESAEAKEHDQDTIREINKALDQSKVRTTMTWPWSLVSESMPATVRLEPAGGLGTAA